MTDMADLRKKKKSDLQKLLKSKKEELYTFSQSILQKKEKNVKKPRLLRKEIARVITVLRETKDEKDN